MFAVFDRDQLVVDAVFLQLFGHHRRLFKWDIGIHSSVNHQRRRIFRGDIPHGFVRSDKFGEFVGWKATDCSRPCPVLSIMQIHESAIALSLSRVRNNGPIGLFKRFFAVDFPRIVPWVRAGLCIPVSDEIAISIKSDQRFRTGFRAVAGHERQVAARRAAAYGHTIGVEVESFRSVATYPYKRRLDVADQFRQFSLWRQTVVDRDQGPPVFLCDFANLAIDSLAMPHDQRTAVDPDNHRHDFVALWSIDVRQYFVALDFAIGDRRFFPLRF